MHAVMHVLPAGIHACISVNRTRADLLWCIAAGAQAQALLQATGMANNYTLTKHLAEHLLADLATRGAAQSSLAAA